LCHWQSCSKIGKRKEELMYDVKPGSVDVQVEYIQSLAHSRWDTGSSKEKKLLAKASNQDQSWHPSLT
jgi:hypothetical protein